MGGVGTSQGTVLSGTKAGAPSGFDLRSWQGLTEVLKTGKESLKDPHAYAEFRNLVLEYAQKGGDAELRKKIDTIIATFGAPKTGEPAHVKSEPKPEPVAPKADERRESSPAPQSNESRRPLGIVGTRRVQPKFAPPSVGETRNVSEVKKVDAVAPPAKPVPEPIPEPAPVPPEISVPAPREVPEPAPEVKSPEVSAPAPKPSAVPTPPAPERPVVVPESAPVPSQGFKTLDEYKARITEIKRIVNSQVGNPATLIDTHNDYGKKYMTALLSALKATGGGGEGIDAAMANLEVAFETLRKDREATEADEGVATEEATLQKDAQRWEEPKDEPVPEAFPEPEEEAAVPAPEVPRPEPVPEPEPEPAPLSEPGPLIIREKPEENIERTDEKIQSAIKTIEREKPKISIGSLFKSDADNAPTTEGEKPETSRVAPGGSWPASRQTLKGIGRLSPEEVKAEGIDTAEVTAKQTELSSPEITATLHQLLSEWNIFHGSGFFGMGPSGHEHPFYKTLAPLSMGEVIAGRWEGGNPKLTKTIKQYVDAWRHEQGIAYVVTETFEHYLRRVVQRIMKRQKGQG